MKIQLNFFYKWFDFIIKSFECYLIKKETFLNKQMIPEWKIFSTYKIKEIVWCLFMISTNSVLFDIPSWVSDHCLQFILKYTASQYCLICAELIGNIVEQGNTNYGQDDTKTILT